jgi:hypothetical protein
MVECYCDYDLAPSLYNARIHTARKVHRCYECRGHILPGERYEAASGIWDGEFSVYKTCGHCRDIRTWTGNNIECARRCWTHGDMISEMEEHIREATEVRHEENAGLRFGFYRRIAIRDRDNKRKKAIADAAHAAS